MRYYLIESITEYIVSVKYAVTPLIAFGLFFFVILNITGSKFLNLKNNKYTQWKI